jgi:two-component system osmolarity sensor histidine kinase EnvZ
MRNSVTENRLAGADGPAEAARTSGPGIPAAQRADAFRPFVRLDHARNLDETGTGLGLAIALDIARAHGGDIRLEASPLGGLRAVVQIPV